MRPYLLLLILLALLFLAGAVAWTGRAADDLNRTITTIDEETEVPKRTTDFTVYRTSDGAKLEDHVTTTQGEIDPTETEAAWKARHRATVEAALQDYLDNGYQLTPPPQPQ